ncbi:MAG: hypothetical protein AAFU71_08430 [Cyanobacteria bacterium J06632_22]
MAPSDGASTAPNSFSQATFQGDVPRWGEAATTVMRELEQWRGHNFIEDLQVTFLPQEDPDLNGWYNSATKELVVTTGASEQMGRGVLLHEIFHALQDQHFNLSQLHIDSQDEPDYDKAVTAIIEGEAMLAVSELLNYNFLDHARLPANGPIPEEFFEKVFLYGAGLKFIEAVRAAGGWEAVDAAFQDPPQATALIFQPKRYLAGERTTPMLAVPVKDGETLQKKMIRGEYEIRLLLVQAPQLRPELDKISKDYVTDTLGILEKLDHTSVHRWLIEFTTAEAATRWQAPFTKALTDNRQTEMAPLISVNGSTLTAEW